MTKADSSKSTLKEYKKSVRLALHHRFHNTEAEKIIDRYQRALHWIEKNTIDGHGIALTSERDVIYPEVTGYYIPTLIRWGHRDLAKSYAKYLISIQKADGSWYDAYDKAPYVFDTGQILRGLVAIQPMLPEAEMAAVRGCEWLLSRMTEEGRLVTPSKDAWGEDRGFCDEHIHLYCLPPLIAAGERFHREDFLQAAEKIKQYYIGHYRDRILHFSMLSHFHAYVMEALIDLGEHDLAEQAMKDIATYQKEDGSVPGRNDVSWICSTGLFQLAIAWYKLGNLERGDRAFYYACSLQNPSGGWYGSYSDRKGTRRLATCHSLRHLFGKHAPTYFQKEEISWAVKYFLDAIYYRNKCAFDTDDDSYKNVSLPQIDPNDGRYQIIHEMVMKIRLGSVLDAGCGQGRYLMHLEKDCPKLQYHGIDICGAALATIPSKTIKTQKGVLTNLPYPNDTFDLVYSCKAVEHAIDVPAAVREMIRVTRSGGCVIVIDKPAEKRGALEIAPWEQWLDDDEMKRIAEEEHCGFEVRKNIHYEDDWCPGLFHAWIYKKL